MLRPSKANGGKEIVKDDLSMGELIWTGGGLMIILLIVASLTSILSNYMDRGDSEYTACVKACGQQKFSDYDLGDRGYKRMSAYGRSEAYVELRVMQPVIQEHDKTDCIKSCNEMYIKIAR